MPYRRNAGMDFSADDRAARTFYEQVYKLVKAIPIGRVTTYGTIALALGAPTYARQVGYALAALPNGSNVPAQRVVNRNGFLSGELAFGPPGTMQALLEAEGVQFKEDGRVNMKLHLWEPPGTILETPAAE